MMQVANRACVRKIAMRSLRAFKTRNMVAVLAIVLTTMMFTALFAITISINDSLQQSNFLISGGDDHGDFKNLTKEQMEQLQKDPLIKESDARLFLGMGTGSAFRKTQVEISYMDAKAVKHYFCTPTHGQVPKEGTNQVMMDTRVLKLLGIKPKVGEPVTITYEIGQDSVNKKEVTEQFVLSGWWDYNGVSTASHMVVPQSYAKKMLRGMKLVAGDETGTWTLGVCFRNSFHIEENMRQVIENQGFQWKDASKDHYIKFGVNWGYTNTQSDNHMDSTSMVAVGALLLLIVFTGYLVIYNVFQISVTNDIRFYGLLKTIGFASRSYIFANAIFLSLMISLSYLPADIQDRSPPPPMNGSIYFVHAGFNLYLNFPATGSIAPMYPFKSPMFCSFPVGDSPHKCIFYAAQLLSNVVVFSSGITRQYLRVLFFSVSAYLFSVA